MAKVPAKEPSLNDALQGDLFANALTGTPTKDLSDIPSDGDNAKANTKLKTKAKAKAKASAKAKSKVQAALEAKAESKGDANTEAKVESKSKVKTKDKNKAEPKLQAETKSEATAKSKGKVQAIAEANAESKSEAQTETKVESKSKNKAKAEVKTDAQTKSHAKTKDNAKAQAKAGSKDKVKTKSKAKHQGQSLTSGKDNIKSNEVLLDPSLELILDAADDSNADTQVISTATATASALTKVKANKHAHKANKSQDKDLVLDANELSNRANMGLLTDTEQTLLSPLFSDVLSEQNILEESKESLLTPHMSSLLEGQELEEQALESELKIVSCTEVNSSASAIASASYSTSANTSDSDSTSASSSDSAQSQSDASNSDTSHSDTKGKSNESVKIELGLEALGSLGALGANLSDSGEFELKVQTLQELEALDKASSQDKADTEDNNAKQGSLFLEGYVVGQGGLFDDVNDEVVNNNDDIELVYVPLKEVSLQEKFSDVLAPSENLPELGEDESDSDVDIYAPQEPAFNFFEPSPDSLQASQFPSFGAETSTHTSAGGSASASTGANAEVKAMGEGKAVMVNHEVESDSTMATKSQDDTKVKATATRKARAGAKSRVKADSKDGTGASAGVDLVTQVGADAGAEAEAGAGAGAGAKTSAKAKAKVVYEPYEYPIDPKVYAVCGIDEAGRGPLMGDVVAACVILDHNHMIEGLNDSKKLTEKARDALAPIIKEQAIAYGIGRASPQEIDSLNILNATFLAMRRAFDAMQKSCNLALIDGNKIPKTFSDIPMVMEAVVKGDARVAEISAASILAKTTRDADCYELDKLYPEYGFARHKGYPTKDHLEALANLPILPCYRKSYGPVKKLLAGSQDDIETISPNVQKRLETAKDTKQKKLDELLIENTLISLDDFA